MNDRTYHEPDDCVTSDNEQLIEELLDYTLLVLQSAKTEEARRVTLAVMNYIKSKRSPAQLQRMETDNMRRALS